MSSTGASATKCVFLKNQPCITRSTLINLNPVELNYYPFIICLDKYNGRCYGVDLSTKIFVPSKIKKKCWSI